MIISPRLHGYPWPFLTTLLYRPLLPVSYQGYIPYRYRIAVCRFQLVHVGLCEGVHRSTSLMSSSRMSGSSNFDSFRNGWWVAVQLLLCWVLPPGLVQYCSHYSCLVAVKLFFYMFSERQCTASIRQYRHDFCLEENVLNFISQVWFPYNK